MKEARTTESASYYTDLEKMPLADLLSNINKEDKSVPLAVEKALPQIEALVERAVSLLKTGGRLFYIGAGTSGRLGILDASELPPTFGADPNQVVGMIAGGDTAIRRAVEFAEDNTEQAIKDLEAHAISDKDMVIGIAASGTTPYVIGGLKACQTKSIATGCITCNDKAPIIEVSDFPVVAVVGPEFVTGSTRMKAGTAQKLMLNMISTSAMIQLGRVKGSKMVDMQLSNDKLVARGIRMLSEELSISAEMAHDLLKKHGSVRAAMLHYTLDH
jgi:N-acetylmuramic acid 6-phosphate etherase